MSLNEYAKKVDKNVEIIKAYLKQGRITGAKLVNGEWEIPADAQILPREVSRR